MPRPKIRILVADDHAIVREGFKLILGREPDLEVVGEAANGLEAVTMAAESKPDIVIMDVSMPELNGVEATLRIKDVSPLSRVIALSMHRDGVYARDILRVGARAYLLKDSAASDLLVAIRAVMRNQGFISPAVVGSVLNEYRKHVTLPLDRLTHREREVLQMLSSGQSNKEIATELNLSPYTVESHRNKIMEKLNLHSITELVRFAMRCGLVD